jgi:hypothetical protein
MEKRKGIYVSFPFGLFFLFIMTLGGSIPDKLLPSVLVH